MSGELLSYPSAHVGVHVRVHGYVNLAHNFSISIDRNKTNTSEADYSDGSFNQTPL